jgi:radical SAM protein with 4Fe4S-binding SPASM domain
MSLNEGEIDEYAVFVSALGASMGLDHGVMRPREGRESLDREPERHSRSQDRFERLSEQYAPDADRIPRSKALDSRLCGAGDAVHVEPNGELRPCTLLDVDLGHAVADGIAAARAENPRYAQLTGLTWRDVRGCRDCDLRRYCTRCHASSLAEVGDALAPYPSACADALSRHARAEGQSARLVADGSADGAIGPYRQLGPGVYRPFEAHATPADDELAARLGWTRRAQAPRVPGERALPGQLVQLRRPGRKRPALERVPAKGDTSQRPAVSKPTRRVSAPTTGAT